MAAIDRKAVCAGFVWLAVIVGSVLLLGSAAGLAGEPGESGAKAILAKMPSQKGICVVLGLPRAEPPTFVTELAAGSELVVYFQSPAAEEVQAVRKAAEGAGLLGRRVFVERGPWQQIHLADNLAGAIWVSPAAREQVPEAELLRVLHPEGKAIVGDREIVKAFPAGIDSWSHPFHGPDNNPQSRDRLARMPYLTQFLAEPKFSPMPEVTVAAGGRIFKAMGHIAHKANQNAMLNTLLGINAYNGTILWSRPLREGFMIHRNTMIATPDLLYLGDDESCKLIDARTGQLRDEIVVPEGVGDGKVWKWMALEEGPGGKPVLYALVGGEEVRPKTVASRVPGLGHWPWSMWEGHEYKDAKTNFAFGRTLVAIDPPSKKILWRHDEQEYLDGRGLSMGAGRIYFYSPESFLGCLDAGSGKVLWKNSDRALLEAIGRTGPAQNPREGYSTTSFIKCSDKYVFFAGPQRPNLVVVSAQDGKLVWQKQGGNLHLVLREEAFYGVGPGGAKMAYDTWEALAALPNRRSCTRATGSVDSVFYRAAEGTMQISTADDRAQHIAPMRPPCQDGVVIANGMLYWGPWMCGCPLSFYGHVGVAPAGSFDFRPGADASRLEPGEGDPAVVKELPVRSGDWPCYRGDNRRTSVTATALAAKVSPRWTFRPTASRRPSAPVAAGDLVFVGDDSGVLSALDAAGGKPRWQAYTAGPIFSAPAVWEGRVYVGSADGRVYAFEAATGRRLWSFRAAPAERWIPVFDKLISTWPVAGGVVVQDGTLYAAAGMAHYDGTHVYALDAVTGKVKWYNDSSGQLSDQVRSGISLQGELFLDDAALCFSGGSVYQTARYDLKTGKCLNEPVHFVRSQFATAYYPYYPQYGRYLSLNQPFPDGRRLTYDALYEGSQHTALAMLRPPRPGEPKPPPARKPAGRTAAGPRRDAVWQCNSPWRFNGFIVGPDAVVAAGEAASEGGAGFFVAALDLKDGSVLWRQDVPCAVVKGGTAVDRTGRIFAALEDGRLLCLAPAEAR